MGCGPHWLHSYWRFPSDKRSRQRTSTDSSWSGWPGPGAIARASGLVVGTLAAWKVFPGFLILWMVLTRRWHAAAWAIAACAAWTVAGLLLVGPDVTLTYLRDVLPATEPMGISVGHLSGAPALGYLAALIGLAAAWMLRRQAATSYAISSLTAILAVACSGIVPSPSSSAWGRRYKDAVFPRRASPGLIDAQCLRLAVG